MPKGSATSYHKPKVLLVEDQPSLQKTHVMMLQNINCKVVLAKDGRAAVEYAKKERFDIIFMDINLPDISGTVAAELIRKNHFFKSNKSYIVALTTCVIKEIKQKCINIGINDIENKPICLDRLRQICFIEKNT